MASESKPNPPPPSDPARPSAKSGSIVGCLKRYVEVLKDPAVKDAQFVQKLSKVTSALLVQVTATSSDGGRALSPPPGVQDSFDSDSDIFSFEINSGPSMDSGLTSFTNSRASTFMGAALMNTPEDVRNSSQPIIDIGILFPSKEKPPEGYIVLKKSIGGSKADLNRGTGGKDIFLCYKRRSPPPEPEPSPTEEQFTSLGTRSSIAANHANPLFAPMLSSPSISHIQVQKDGKETKNSNDSSTGDAADSLAPITSLSIVFTDLHEEPPYGFELITKSVSGMYDADLNAGTNGHRIYLGVHRGGGPFITELGVILQEKREACPSGFHEVKHTPFGNVANINAGTTAAHIYLCYKPFVPCVIRRCQNFQTVARTEERYGRTLACLAAGLYSGSQEVVVGVLEAFRLLPVPLIPPQLLNGFIQCVCDGVANFLSFFNTTGFRQVLHFLLGVFKVTFNSLSVDTAVRMFQTCIELRHEDKKDRISRQMVDWLITHTPRCDDVQCKCLEERRRQLALRKRTVSAAPQSVPIANLPGISLHPRSNSIALPNDRGSPRTPPAAVGSFTGTSGSPRTHHANSMSVANASQLVSAAAGARSYTAAHGRDSQSGSPRQVSAFASFAGASHKRTASAAVPNSGSPGHNSQPSSPQFDFTPKPLAGTPPHSARSGSLFVNSSLGPHISREESAESYMVSPVLSPVNANGESKKDEANCRKCRHLKAIQSASQGQFVGWLVQAMVSNVQTAKAMEPHANQFLQHGWVGPDFRSDLVEFVTENFTDHSERVYVAITLTCSKYAAEYATFNLKKSEKIKRKAHTLQLLVHILKNSGDFFTGGGSGPSMGLPFTVEELILRRHICTSLIDCCVTDVPSIFNLNLQMFVLMWIKFRDQLMIELGVMMDHIFIGLLESPQCTTQQKRDIIDAFLRIFQEEGAIIYLFYNYDNDCKGWRIYERLMNALTRLVEGDLVRNDKDIEPGEDELRKRALEQVVKVMYVLAQWIGAPGFKPMRRASEVLFMRQLAPAPLVTEVVAESDLLAGARTDDDFESLVPAGRVLDDLQGAQEVELDEETGEEDLPKSQIVKSKTFSRSTWGARHERYKVDAKVIQTAVQLASTDSLKAALKHLRSNSPGSNVPQVLANFLIVQNSALEKEQVGDILGNEQDSLMNKQEYDKLRRYYMEHLDFTGMDFNSGLRLFLCDAGFRLPGESQKVDRLLECFANKYCRDNPSSFLTASSAYILSFACVMLNTDIHDPRLRTGNSNRKPMTEQQFINNLRGVDDGRDFNRAFLHNLYAKIAANPIEWRAPPGGAAEAEQAEEKEQDFLEQEKQFRKHYELLARKAQAWLKSESCTQRNFHTTNSVAIVKAIFEVSWQPVAAAFNVLVEHHKDAKILQLCLDGIAYSAITAITLRLENEYKTYLQLVAKTAFIEQHRGAPDLTKRLLANEHLKLDWLGPLIAHAKANPSTACREVLRIVQDTKQRMSYERHQEQLRHIQSEFGGEINLVERGRQFIFMDVLTKVSSKRVPYTFFLFNDLLIYASEGIQTKYKVHRVVHLSLVKIIDIRTEKDNPPAFKVVNPQKSIVVAFRDEKHKKQWLDYLLKNVEAMRVKQKEFLIELKRKQKNRKRDSAGGLSERAGSPAAFSSDDTDHNIRQFSPTSPTSGPLAAAEAGTLASSRSDMANSSFTLTNSATIPMSSAALTNATAGPLPIAGQHSKSLSIASTQSASGNSGTTSPTPNANGQHRSSSPTPTLSSTAEDPHGTGTEKRRPPVSASTTQLPSHDGSRFTTTVASRGSVTGTQSPVARASTLQTFSNKLPSPAGGSVTTTSSGLHFIPAFSTLPPAHAPLAVRHSPLAIQTGGSFSEAPNLGHGPPEVSNLGDFDVDEEEDWSDLEKELHEHADSIDLGRSVSDETLDDADAEILRGYSAFIGVSSLDPAEWAERSNRKRNHCKLCIRAYTILRRKMECGFCKDTVCTDCCVHKFQIPDSNSRSLQRVCDACAGALKQMYNEKTPAFTEAPTVVQNLGKQ